MSQIEIKKGLDIPLEGAPVGDVQNLVINGLKVRPRQVALDLSCFSIGFRLLVKPGDVVKIGQPLAHDKKIPERLFVSPGGGVVSEVRRGLKRRLSLYCDRFEPGRRRGALSFHGSLKN